MHILYKLWYNEKKSQEEAKMFEVSDKASEMITEYFKDKNEVPSVRIVLDQGGWAGPTLGLVLDEPKDDDEVVNKNGNTFMINKDFLGQVAPVKVDFIETDRGSGYSISSNLSAGGACGDSCNC